VSWCIYHSCWLHFELLEQSGNSMGTFNGNAKVKFPALNYVLFLDTERSGANKTIQTGQRAKFSFCKSHFMPSDYAFRFHTLSYTSYMGIFLDFSVGSVLYSVASFSAFKPPTTCELDVKSLFGN